MNYALIVYRCEGQYLYCVEEYETCAEVESRIEELLEDTDNDFTYRVYGESMIVKITPPAKSTVSVF